MSVLQCDLLCHYILVRSRLDILQTISLLKLSIVTEAETASSALKVSSLWLTSITPAAGGEVNPHAVNYCWFTAADMDHLSREILLLLDFSL